jgi:hypothetical protein
MWLVYGRLRRSAINVPGRLRPCHSAIAKTADEAHWTLPGRPIARPAVLHQAVEAAECLAMPDMDIIYSTALSAAATLERDDDSKISHPALRARHVVAGSLPAVDV